MSISYLGDESQPKVGVAPTAVAPSGSFLCCSSGCTCCSSCCCSDGCTFPLFIFCFRSGMLVPTGMASKSTRIRSFRSLRPSASISFLTKSAGLHRNSFVAPVFRFMSSFRQPVRSSSLGIRWLMLFGIPGITRYVAVAFSLVPSAVAPFTLLLL